MIFTSNQAKVFRLSNKPKVLKDILIRDVSLVHYCRGIPKFTDGWLETLRLPKMRDYSITITHEDLLSLAATLEKQIRKIGRSINVDIVNWLSMDISDHVVSFMDVTGAQEVIIRLKQNGLQALDNSIYENHIKMICNYGPEKLYWVNSQETQANKLVHVEPLDVLLLKGKKWPGLTSQPIELYSAGTLDNKNSLLVEIEYLN